MVVLECEKADRAVVLGSLGDEDAVSAGGDGLNDSEVAAAS